MNAESKDKEDQISIITISEKLTRILDEMKIITDEIEEMKEREGSEHGDN